MKVYFRKLTANDDEMSVYFLLPTIILSTDFAWRTLFLNLSISWLNYAVCLEIYH